MSTVSRTNFPLPFRTSCRLLLRDRGIVVVVVVVVVATVATTKSLLYTHGPSPFLAFIIQSYGSVLSPLPGAANEDQQGNLSRALGSVVGIACLRTEGRVGPQLTSHVFGLLKARAAQDNLSEEDRWLASDEGTEWVIRTVDTLLDVVMAERDGTGGGGGGTGRGTWVNDEST